MASAPLRFRQIHLDFHTSPDIPKIGSKFDTRRWQETLKRAEVDSVTCFAKCHHGWSYHPTKVGKMHPHLNFDLLRAQYEACREIGVNVPVYISVGVDDVAVDAHPEWREIAPDGSYAGWNRKPLEPGFKTLDFHSPYLDYLCAQIEEVMAMIPDWDGVFLDIINQQPNCGKWSMEYMLSNGLDPENPADRLKCAKAALEKYFIRSTAACQSVQKDMHVIHNSGHISRGEDDFLKYQTHLELESLPTGGWGYDHFPESAKYVSNTGREFLGMTGKFHTTWGEFGGFKHPNALRYECAAMIAQGARCSVGDQLHPEGVLDESTYDLIGEAYREVKIAEPWCIGSEQIAEIGVLSSEAEAREGHRASHADTGATRILLEGHFLFTLLDRKMDFSRVKLLILPDDILMDDALKAKISAYLGQGGKLLLTGKSGLNEDGSGFAFDIGANWSGTSEFDPDYILPAPEFRPAFVKNSPFVMYAPSQRIRVTTGKSAGAIYDPYFNRTYLHYCSHQHTPAKSEPSGYDCGVINGAIGYLAHPVFSIYRGTGAVALKDYVLSVVRHLLGGTAVSATLPSTARLTLTRQEEQSRWVLHLLYANTISRGGQMKLSGGTVAGTTSIEVIEELLPLHNTRVSLRLPGDIRRITLEPQGKEVEFQKKDGTVEFTVDEFSCHQMVAIS